MTCLTISIYLKLKFTLTEGLSTGGRHPYIHPHVGFSLNPQFHAFWTSGRSLGCILQSLSQVKTATWLRFYTPCTVYLTFLKSVLGEVQLAIKAFEGEQVDPLKLLDSLVSLISL